MTETVAGERTASAEHAVTGGPPSEAGTLYQGEVMHQRLRPFGHRFTYRVFSLLVDIDRLGELRGLAGLLSVNRPGIVSFHERDHVEHRDETVRQFADRLLREAGLDRPAQRVLLLVGDADEMVPPAHSRELLRLARSARQRKLVSFPKGTHNDTCLQPGYFEAIRDFLRERPPPSVVTVEEVTDEEPDAARSRVRLLRRIGGAVGDGL